MKLIGYIDGVEVNFDFIPPNQFKAIVPRHLDGTYIVELQAEDNAGNCESITDIVVAIDFDKLSFRILDKNYHVNENSKDFSYKVHQQVFLTMESEVFYFKQLQQQFLYKELV